MSVTYSSSGVNINEAEKFVEKLKPLVKKTFSKNVLSGIGNFGSFYKLDLRKYNEPVLVSSIDGVGTKLKLASILNKYDTVGEDLVNHCVNDIAVCGAVPLYFLDYYATGKLESDIALKILNGFVKGCKENKCSLIGGETAEMPGIYNENDFDLAGCIVGIAEKNRIINYEKVRKDDVIVGIKSNGLHTNGFSLVRKIFDKIEKLNKYYKELNSTLGEELLRVHRSYLSIIQKSISKFNIKSISHITGGGIEGNTKRVIPKKRKLIINWNNWERPFIYDLIQRTGKVPEEDMRKTFNLGIGLIFIISISEVIEFQKFLKRNKEDNFIIGSIE